MLLRAALMPCGCLAGDGERDLPDLWKAYGGGFFGLLWCTQAMALQGWCVSGWRKVKESNPHPDGWLGFQDRLPTTERHLPKAEPGFEPG